MSYRSVDENEHAAGFGMNIGMDRTNTGHADATAGQARATQYEVTIEHVYELRELVRMDGQSRARLEPNDLQLEATRYSNVLYEYSAGERRGLPR